jgi:hypothetical protein
VNVPDETRKKSLATRRSMAYMLFACSVIAFFLSGGFAWAFRDWSLAGFFLAVALAAGGMSAVFWPD